MILYLYTYPPFQSLEEKVQCFLWSPPSTSLSVSNGHFQLFLHPPLPGGLWKCGSCGWETWRRVTQGTLFLCIGGKNREILQVHIFSPKDRIEIVKSKKRCFLFWCLGNRVTNNLGEWLSIISPWFYQKAVKPLYDSAMERCGAS